MPEKRGAFVAIFGSRSHPNLEQVERYVETLPMGTTVVSGGALGVDSAAREAALANSLDVLEYCIAKDEGAIHAKLHRRDRPTLVKKVGVSPVASVGELAFFRNTWIAVRSDRGVAFPAESAGGTWDTIRQFERFRKPCEQR